MGRFSSTAYVFFRWSSEEGMNFATSTRLSLFLYKCRPSRRSITEVSWDSDFLCPNFEQILPRE
jgi:hypothetical protein